MQADGIIAHASGSLTFVDINLRMSPADTTLPQMS